jgi:N utilization substance protein B
VIEVVPGRREAGVKSGVKKSVGKRRRAREMAVQMLYQLELGGSPLEQVFAAFDTLDYLRESRLDEAVEDPASSEEALRKRHAAEERQLDDAFAYARQLVEGTALHGDEIDRLIRRHAENWRLERMPAIDRNILRLALFEMLFQAGVPKVVIVDEAIELAKKYGAENSGRFVNGLLDGVLRSDREGRIAVGPEAGNP